MIRSGMTGRIGEPYNAEAAQHHLAPAEKGDLVVTARTYDASASTNMKYSPKDGVWRQVDEKGRIMFYEYDSEEKDWRKVVQIAERNWEIYLFDRDKEAWQLVGRYEQSRLGNTQCWRLGLFDRPNNRWWTKAFFVPEMLTGQPIAWEPVWVFNEKKRCWLEDDKKETKNWQLPSIKLEQQPIRVLVRSAQGRSAPRAGLASAGKCGCGR